MRTEKVPAGKLIFTEGDNGDEAYRIIEGRVEISIHDNGQKLYWLRWALERSLAKWL